MLLENGRFFFGLNLTSKFICVIRLYKIYYISIFKAGIVLN